jgi:ABC-type Fe3+-hydroxamate transport system substrate-binding protein
MKPLSLIILAVLTILFLIGCNSNSNSNSNSSNNVNTKTEFFKTVEAVINQKEDDEPLAIEDSIDNSSSFNTLL